MLKLRPYQSRSVDEIRAAFAGGARSVLYVLPTGGGKTVVFSHIAHCAAALGTRACILVHRDALLRQASAALTAGGVAHGVIAAGRARTEASIQVASVQTLARRLGRHVFDLLVIDEAHHAVAGTWRRVADAYPEAHVLGVTATAQRLDGRGLGDVFQSMVQGPSIADLTAAGWLSPVTVYAPAMRLDLSGVHARAGDYAQDELADLMGRPGITGDAVSQYRYRADGQSALAFCVSVAHAEAVWASFNAAGYRAEVIHGGLPTAQIHDAIACLTASRIQVLVSVDLISEGFDCPGVRAVIMLRPTRSEALYVQQAGRAMRPAPGKSGALILDHAGNVFSHGMPDAVREWTLAGRVRRRGLGAGVDVRQCPDCYACHPPALTCPACGHVYPAGSDIPRTREGDLEAVKAERVERMRRLRERIRQARTIEDFHVIARDFGYQPSWASINFQYRRGRA